MEIREKRWPNGTRAEDMGEEKHEQKEGQEGGLMLIDHSPKEERYVWTWPTGCATRFRPMKRRVGRKSPKKREQERSRDVFRSRGSSERAANGRD
jgi:hypothetical protein